MIEINLYNVEKFFYNYSEILSSVENFKIYYDQWVFSKINNSFRNIGKQALIDFINNVTDEEIIVLQEKIGVEVIVKKVNNRLILNQNCDINDCSNFLENYNFSIYRKKDKLKITCWK